MATTKVVMPVVQLYKSSQQADIETQEQKTSEESDSEKTNAEKDKVEINEQALAHWFILLHSSIGASYHSCFVSLLPARYFAVPTPPPWYHC